MVLYKGDTAMVAKRILYVNYSPARLIRDEELLMRAGYELDTVFGIDGVMACGSIAEHTSISIDETCPLEEKEKLIRWLTVNFPRLYVLPAA
jgi:hypothetical protein